jgi:hypothetical protein
LRNGHSSGFGARDSKGAFVGSSTRAQADSQYISPRHVRSFIGKWSPGPAAYYPDDDGRLGRDSKKWTMTARRVPLIHAPPKNDSVGPGSHSPFDHHDTIGKPSLTTPNAPSFTVGGGKQQVRLRPEENLRKGIIPHMPIISYRCCR